MPNTIPVRFRYATRDLLFDVGELLVQEADHVICSTERGLEIGIATASATEMSTDEVASATSGAELKPVLRVATDEDLAHAEELAAKGDEAMAAFRECVAALELDMKPVAVEYLFEGEKAVCYFAAEERVDFRQLVRDLARELHARIDMRQIGVREEAAVVGGYGHCGQELCCTRFGLSFEPVSIRMAKEQDLPLNSTKISGACGRLMCCLRYEFEAYKDFKSRAPKKNTLIDTPLGKAKIIEYNTPKEELALRIENGKVIRVALADMETSEAACKKSEELGCACRPDTVTREVLERLQSPDVQMALAELDRKNGIIPEEETHLADDIFVAAPRPHKQRAEKDDTVDENASARTAEPVQAGENTRKRRRRAHTQVADNTPAENASARPRRRPGDKGGAVDAKTTFSTTTHEGTPVRRRRRHHGGTHDSNQSGAE